MTNLELIQTAEASIVILGNRLLEDVYWLKSINAKKTPNLYMAVNLRNCIYYYSLEITCIEKAMLATELPYVKRYHNKNLIANISEGFKALYNFGKLRKKSIWVKFQDVVARFNNPIMDIKYQSITNHLAKFEQTYINQPMRDIVMHYDEDMLRVYIETANLKDENKAMNLFVAFCSMLNEMNVFVTEVIDKLDSSTEETVVVQSSLLGSNKVNLALTEVNSEKKLTKTLSDVLKAAPQDLDYIAHSWNRFIKFKQELMVKVPQLQSDDIMDVDKPLKIISEQQLLLRFMALDIAVITESFCQSKTSIEAAMHLRRAIIHESAMLQLFFGITSDEQQVAMWTQLKPDIPADIQSVSQFVDQLKPCLLSMVDGEKRALFVHCYDNKGRVLVNQIIDRLEVMDFKKELINIHKLIKFYGFMMQVLPSILASLREKEHKIAEESRKRTNDMIHELIRQIETSKFPDDIKSKILCNINSISKILNKDN